MEEARQEKSAVPDHSAASWALFHGVVLGHEFAISPKQLPARGNANFPALRQQHRGTDLGVRASARQAKHFLYKKWAPQVLGCVRGQEQEGYSCNPVEIQRKEEPNVAHIAYLIHLQPYIDFIPLLINLYAKLKY